MSYDCEHLENCSHRAHPVVPSGEGCKECLDSGGVWVHLRLCLTCGHVGCCDNSPNHHATQHHRETGHAVIRSYEPRETWAYCYPHEAYAEHLPADPSEAAPMHFDPP